MTNFLLDGVWWFTKKKQSSLQFVSAVMTKDFHVAFKPRMLEKKITITQINDHILKDHQDILELMENYFFKNICYAQLHTDSTSFLLIMKPWARGIFRWWEYKNKAETALKGRKG